MSTGVDVTKPSTSPTRRRANVDAVDVFEDASYTVNVIPSPETTTPETARATSRVDAPGMMDPALVKAFERERARAREGGTGGVRRAAAAEVMTRQRGGTTRADVPVSDARARDR